MLHRRLVIPCALCIGVLFVLSGRLSSQVPSNPFRTNYNWDKLEGRKIGVASGIKMDPDGTHMWILDRCGANGCAESDLDPIIQVDMDGKFVKSFGKGIMNFPHGFFIDREGNIWVTDGAPARAIRAARPASRRASGHQVYKFSPDGKVLMRLGEAGVPGADETHFNGPTGVVVAQNGDIWITDGHGGPQRRARTKTTCTARAAATTGWCASRRTASSSRRGAAASAPRAPAAAVQRSARHRDRRRGPALHRRPRQSARPGARQGRQLHHALDAVRQAERDRHRHEGQHLRGRRHVRRSVESRDGSAAFASATSRPAGSRRSFRTRKRRPAAREPSFSASITRARSFPVRAAAPAWCSIRHSGHFDPALLARDLSCHSLNVDWAS